MNILIINAGSSSLKYQLMDPDTGVVSAKGLCERIGIDGRLNHNANGKKVVKDIPMPTHVHRRDRCCWPSRPAWRYGVLRFLHRQ